MARNARSRAWFYVYVCSQQRFGAYVCVCVRAQEGTHQVGDGGEGQEAPQVRDGAEEDQGRGKEDEGDDAAVEPRGELPDRGGAVDEVPDAVPVWWTGGVGVRSGLR